MLEKEYEGWGPDVQTLIKCMPDKPSKWSIHVVHPPLDSFVRDRVVLIGDAVRPPSSDFRGCADFAACKAHAMLPHLGAGAGQGLEDAYVLTRLLSHPETNVNNLEVCRYSHPTMLLATYCFP